MKVSIFRPTIKGIKTQRQHALLSMLEKWNISLDKGGYGGAVLMDLSKAFDTVNHDLLIAKLDAYGFDKGGSKLIKSYLKIDGNEQKLTKFTY